MKVFISIAIVVLLSCSNSTRPNLFLNSVQIQVDTGSTVKERFKPPENYNLLKSDSHSFAFYLQSFPLHPSDYAVHLFNGQTKQNPVHAAVLDIDVGNRDLQQCADAVMRLRAEYLYTQKQYQKISFRFLGDGKMHPYTDYAKGDYSYSRYRKYMDYVFSYANTASLKVQLKPKSWSNVTVGDVLIQSGNPYGHAVIVMNLCTDSAGNKRILLAQSYMPAQEIHLLKNYNNPEESPWYDCRQNLIETPEWTFDTTDLRTWQE